jgi:hypothetical protein
MVPAETGPGDPPPGATLWRTLTAENLKIPLSFPF